MEIIKANETHIPEILEIYEKARKFMKENGNPTHGKRDIRRERSWKRILQQIIAMSAWKMRRWLGYLSLSLERILHIA